MNINIIHIFIKRSYYLMLTEHRLVWWHIYPCGLFNANKIQFADRSIWLIDDTPIDTITLKTSLLGWGTCPSEKYAVSRQGKLRVKFIYKERDYFKQQILKLFFLIYVNIPKVSSIYNYFKRIFIFIEDTRFLVKYYTIKTYMIRYYLLPSSTALEL